MYFVKKAIGVLFEIREVYLGFTFLSLGAMIPDFIINLSLLNKGFPVMALSGATAGPLFNLLFGFGLSLIRQTISKTVELDMFNKSKVVFHLSLFTLFFHFARLFGQIANMRFELTSCVGKFGLLIYLLFVGFVSFYEFTN